MRIYLTICLAVGLSALLPGCKDDSATVNVQDVTTPFLPGSADDSEEAQLRREFYSTYGSFLLFNDTLQHYETGRDVNGEMRYFTELLDLTYEVGMSSYTNSKYTFTLLTGMEEKRAAVAYLQENLLPHLTGKLRPYSWLLVDKITRDFNGNISSPYAASGQRAVAVACNVLPRLKNESQKATYTRNVMNVVINKLTTDNEQAFDEFFRVSAAYYDGTFTDPKTTAANTAILNEAGFICRGQELGRDVNGLYPSQSLDLNAFARLVTGNTSETIATRYAQYPLVVQKAEIMRRILTDLGYKE